MVSPTGWQLSVAGTGVGGVPGWEQVGLVEDERHLTQDRPLGERSKVWILHKEEAGAD